MHYKELVVLLRHTVFDTLAIHGTNVIEYASLGTVWLELLREFCDRQLKKSLTHADHEPWHAQECADANRQEAEDKERARQNDTTTGQKETYKSRVRLTWFNSYEHAWHLEKQHFE